MKKGQTYKHMYWVQVGYLYFDGVAPTTKTTLALTMLVTSRAGKGVSQSFQESPVGEWSPAVNIQEKEASVAGLYPY